MLAGSFAHYSDHESFRQSVIQNLLDVHLQEILRVIMETKVDIHVDPLLMKACAVNLKHFCYDVPAGEGRRK